ncbi:MAG: HAMP domain-containing protein [Candidatus Omnitrophica bacterium]|nr:HAMP domain-containing protein [Candidatus Omnitrophota bacterium]
MKIANKISLLVLFLIAALSINTFIALRQVSRLGEQLREVTDKDIVLTDVANTVTRRYLENAIRFQALLNVGDELAFAQMPESRRQYLLSHINKIKESFDRLTQKTGESVIKGKELIRVKLKNAANLSQEQDLRQAGVFLEKIESSYVEYDKLFNDIFKMISAGSYELSLEDLDQVHRKEKILAEKITSLLEEIRQSTQKTLAKASQEEGLARKSLLLGLLSIVVVSLLTFFFLIRSFSKPLKALVFGTQQIGLGNFKVRLDAQSHDEIGEVSTAFNAMTKQLDEFKAQLEKQNDVLSTNLELTKSQKQDIEKVNTELDRFVYTVSHDIAAPLTGIEGYGAFLEQHYFDQFDEKGQRSLKGLRRATKHLTAMIKDLLALTRISRIKNPYEKVEIRVVLDAVLDRLEYLIRESHAEIVIAAPMPSIVCDRVKLTEVLHNVINNAIKFSSKKSSRPRVEIRCVEQAHFYEFTVADNGIGIAFEDKEKIYGIFQRLDNAAEYDGTGAGLSIAKAGVEDHGGKIWVESRLGEGATFHFTIPKGLQATLSKIVAS